MVFIQWVERVPMAVFIGAEIDVGLDGDFLNEKFLRAVLNASKELHARHCLADGSNELQCPQRKNVGTAVSCSLVIQVLLYYCMYVSLLYLMLYNLQNVNVLPLMGQKYFLTKIFPYIFHIKPLIFITFL